jgi:small subunit ribosomal protein S6
MINKDYETLFIVKADLTDEEIDKEINDIVELVKSDGGTIIEEDRWGKKRLAFVIKKQRYGFYVLLRFTANSLAPEKLNRQFRFNENLLKGMIVLFDGAAGRKSPEKLKEEAERAAAGNNSSDDIVRNIDRKVTESASEEAVINNDEAGAENGQSE